MTEGPDFATDIIGIQAQRGNSAILRQKLLEGHPHDVTTNYSKWLPIHLAAYGGHNSCVKILLEHNPENSLKDATNIYCETPIFLAALKGHDKVMKTLLEYDANIEKENWNSETVLVAAVSGQNKDCVKICLDNKIDINKQCHRKYTPLHGAASIGDVGITKFLLEALANINIENWNKETPLFIAAQKGHHECMKTLMDNGGNIQMSNINKETPLFIASQEGHLECVKILLDAGADVKCQTTSYATALHAAAEGDNPEIVKLLIKAGADVNAKSEQGNTPLFLAAQADQVDSLVELIEAGADTNTKLKEDQGTPLGLACSVGSVRCCEELVKRGCDPDRVYLKNGTLQTSTLMEAIDRGEIDDRWRKDRSDCASILLENGADANRLTYSYPLITAAKNCDPDCVSVLLDHGADVNIVDPAGNTPLMSCIMQGIDYLPFELVYQLNCLIMLLKAGADTKLLSCSKSPFQSAMEIDRMVSTDLILLLLTFAPHEPSIKEYMNRYLPSYIETDESKEIEKVNKIMKLLENPSSLSHLSRLKVRELLKSNRLHKIKEFTLPKVLHEYLEFQDLSEYSEEFPTFVVNASLDNIQRTNIKQFHPPKISVQQVHRNPDNTFSRTWVR